MARILCEQERETLYEAVRVDDKLKQAMPGIRPLIIDLLRANFLISTITKRYQDELNHQVDDERERLQRTHPYRSLIKTWMRKRLAALRKRYCVQHREQLFTDLLQALEQMPREPVTDQSDIVSEVVQVDGHAAAGRRIDAFESSVVVLARADIHWRRTNELQEMRAIKHESEVFSYRLKRRIWRPRHWIIQEHNNHQGVVYHAVKHRTIEIHSSQWFWRLRWFWHLLVKLSSDLVFALLVSSIWQSSFGIRALFKTSSFQARYQCDVNTGRIVPKNSRTRSWIGNVRGIAKRIAKSRARFEAKPDRSFFGKNVSRLFNLAWNYLVRLPLGIVLVGIGYPILIIINIIVSFILVITFWIWVPILTIITYLFAVLVYDFLHRKHHSVGKPVPLPSIICRLLVRCLGRLIFCIIAIIVTPFLALLLALYAIVRWVWRRFVDITLFWLCIRFFGRVSAQDDHISRRIAGPGLASLHYDNIAPPVVSSGATRCPARSTNPNTPSCASILNSLVHSASRSTTNSRPFVIFVMTSVDSRIVSPNTNIYDRMF
jgi:hypothetical protein